MAIVGTKFEVSDNSGAKQVQCIRIVSKEKRATIGSIILVSIKQLKHKDKVSKGDLKLAVIVELKTNKNRYDGNSFSSNRNAVVLINDMNCLPTGTRILGTVPYELRQRNCLKLISLGTNTI